MSRRYTVRVYYEDTDAGGIVYHANYLRFAERARTEMMRDTGIDHARLSAEHGGVLAVTRCDARFLAPARLDDLLTVTTTVTAVTGARMQLLQSVSRGGLPLCRLEIELAFIAANARPRRLPPALVAACRRP